MRSYILFLSVACSHLALLSFIIFYSHPLYTFYAGSAVLLAIHSATCSTHFNSSYFTQCSSFNWQVENCPLLSSCLRNSLNKYFMSIRAHWSSRNRGRILTFLRSRIFWNFYRVALQVESALFSNIEVRFLLSSSEISKSSVPFQESLYN